jgi:plastocyanin
MRRKTLSIILAALVAIGAVWAAGAAVTITQKGKVFSESTVTIKAGQSVRFVNDDTVTHNVFAKGENFSFNLKKQAPGTESTVVFPEEGTYECRCAIHPNMKLEVKVVK